MKALISLFLSFFLNCAIAQEVTGVIYDAHYEPLMNVHIQLLNGTDIMYSGNTAYDGSYDIKAVDPGTYDMLITHSTFDSVTCLEVIIPQDWKTTINFKLRKILLNPTNLIMHYQSPVFIGSGTAYNNRINEITTKPYQGIIENATVNNTGSSGVTMTRLPVNYIIEGHICKPAECWPQDRFKLIDLRNPSMRILSRTEISQMPARNLNDILALSPGVYQSRPGEDLHIYGSRKEGTLYILDGMQLPWW